MFYKFDGLGRRVAGDSVSEGAHTVNFQSGQQTIADYTIGTAARFANLIPKNDPKPSPRAPPLRIWPDIKMLPRVLPKYFSPLPPIFMPGGNPNIAKYSLFMRQPKTASQWINIFSNIQDNEYGKLSCDLAEDYWNGRLSDTAMVELLNSSCLKARHSASWAISDHCKLNAASIALMNLARTEKDYKLTARALTFAAKCTAISHEEKHSFISRFLADDDKKVRELASSLLAEDWNPVQRIDKSPDSTAEDGP